MEDCLYCKSYFNTMNHEGFHKVPTNTMKQRFKLGPIEKASYSIYLKSCLATFLTSTLLPSPIKTGQPFANSTASSTVSAFTIT